MIDNIFLQISALLGITVSIAFLIRLMRQPLIVAYIIAGLVAGPLFINSVQGGKEFYRTFAEFGIVFLLFIVGLSLNYRHIKHVGKKVIHGALWQFLISVVLGVFLLKALHFSLISSLFIAIAITFSSTIIVIKLLSDKKDLETVYGRFVVGLLLIQDIIAIILLIFINTRDGYKGSWYEAVLLTGGKGLLLLLGVYLLSRYLLPFIMDRVARSSEFMFIFTIAWCFGIASLVKWAGFNIEIGAIIAGISLGASPYQPEIASRLRPLRDFFIIIFFIVLGSELQIANISSALGPAIIISLLVLIIDPPILYFIMRRFSYSRRSSVLAGITAAQVSEFGFILVFKGQELGYLNGDELAILTLVALATIVISSYLITYNEQIYRKLIPFLNRFGKDSGQMDKNKIQTYPVWVFGYHRIGWKVCEALAEKKIKYAVVDFSPEAIKKMEHRGINCYFGDAADVEFLDSLSLDKAKLIVLTIPEADDQKTLITHVRHLSDKPIIVANLYQAKYIDDLYEAGANYVMMPHLLGGQWISEILKHHAWTNSTFEDLRTEQREELKLRYTAGAHQ